MTDINPNYQVGFVRAMERAKLEIIKLKNGTDAEVFKVVHTVLDTLHRVLSEIQKEGAKGETKKT